MTSDVLGEDIYKALPAVAGWGSDSAMLDNTLEFLYMAGIDLPKAMMLFDSEAWQNDRNMPRCKKDFYQYYATMMEPWTGLLPSSSATAISSAAVLDRNGLRPSRLFVTKTIISSFPPKSG